MVFTIDIERQTQDLSSLFVINACRLYEFRALRFIVSVCFAHFIRILCDLCSTSRAWS